MAERIERYGCAWSYGTPDLKIEMDMIRKGGRWQKHNGKMAGEGLFFHFKRFQQILWPHEKIWHRWNELQLECYLKYRTTVIIGPASSGKTNSVATDLLTDWFNWPECTTCLFCSTTRERLEDRIWGEVKKYFKLAKERYPWLPGHLIEGRQRILQDEKLSAVEGRDFRNGMIGIPVLRGGSYEGLGCFSPGTMVDTPNGPTPIENIRTGDLVISAIGPRRVKSTQKRTAEQLVRVHLSNGQHFDCTPEHPFLTLEGWKPAIDISPHTMLVSPHETMQILREEHQSKGSNTLLRFSMPGPIFDERVSTVPSGIHSGGPEKYVLLQVLHDEIEDERPGNGETNHATQGFESDRQESEREHHVESGGTTSEVHEGKVMEGAECYRKVKAWLDKEAFKRGQGFWKSRERMPSDSGRVGTDGHIPGSPIQSSHPLSSRGKDIRSQNWLPTLLQAGPWLVGYKAGRRSGWGITFKTEAGGPRQEERRPAERVWLDHIEVLERGSDSIHDKSSTGYRVHNLEVEGHPSYSVCGVLVHNSFVGIKNKRVRLAGDELQLLPSAFVDSISNLDKNTDFKAIGMGNPKDITDALGRLAEPAAHLGGWDGGIDQSPGTKTWEIRRPNGICVQLPGSDSPNLDGKLGIPLITQEQIDRDVAFYGKDSLWYTMFNEGRMPRGQGARRVLTREMCVKFQAMEDPNWLNQNITKIAFLDAAYRGVGGDRCVFGELWFGDEVPPSTEAINVSSLISQSGDLQKRRQILALHELRIVPINPGQSDLPEDQIVRFVQGQCVARGIPAANFFFDAGMRTSLVSAFARLWSNEVNTIDCGGRPSERQVSNDITVKCRDYYSKFITELWFSVRLAVESRQTRGLSDEVINEFSSREWKIVAGNKIEVESKDDMKKKIGRSPDLADAFAIGVHGAIERGFRIEKLSKQRHVGRGHDWRTDFKKKSETFWRSGELVNT